MGSFCITKKKPHEELMDLDDLLKLLEKEEKELNSLLPESIINIVIIAINIKK